MEVFTHESSARKESNYKFTFPYITIITPVRRTDTHFNSSEFKEGMKKLRCWRSGGRRICLYRMKVLANKFTSRYDKTH
jgi:hypothetical protein